MATERDELRELFAEAVTEPRAELRETTVTALEGVKPRRRRRAWFKVVCAVAAVPLLLGAGVASGLLPFPWVEGTLYYRSASHMGPGWDTGNLNFPALTGQEVIDDEMPSPDSDCSPVTGDIAWAEAPAGYLPQRDVHVIEEGGDERNLTRDTVGGFNCKPRWSPDGTKIAFLHTVLIDDQQPCKGGFQVWVINADGSDPHQAAEEGTPPTDGAVWCPDSKRLLLNLQGADTDKYEVNLANGRLTARPEFKGAATWSPDGEWLAAVPSTEVVQNGRPGRLNQLVIVDAKGEQRRVLAEQFIDEGEVLKRYPTEKQLTENPKTDWVADLYYHVGPKEPQWSPEGDKIGFLAALPFDPNGIYYREQVEVWIYDLRADELVRVTDDNEAQYSLVWRKPRD